MSVTGTARYAAQHTTHNTIALTIRGYRSPRELKQFGANLDRKHALVREDMRDPGDGALGERLDDGRHAVGIGGADGRSRRGRHGGSL